MLKPTLEKEKEKFVKQMENAKKDFNSEITDLENLTGTFKQKNKSL